MHRISTPEAIAGYWKALDAWRIAARQKDALSAKLPADLKRAPRVLHGHLIGSEGRTPLYARGEWEIQQVIDQRKSIFPLGVNDAPSRKSFRASLDRYAKKLKRELDADRQALLAAQTEAGWTRAVESERTCRSRVYRALDKVRYSQIGSGHEALALIEFVAKVTDQENRARKEGSPYGLAAYLTTALLRKAAAYLSGEAQDSLKEAA